MNSLTIKLPFLVLCCLTASVLTAQIYQGGTGSGSGRSSTSGFLVGMDPPPPNPYAGGSGSGSSNAFFVGTTSLPLTLVSFTATAKETRVVLEWTTEREVGTDYFLVERLGGNGYFTTVDRLPAAGFSPPGRQLHYTLYDEAPAAGTTYYRLTTVDFDGSESISPLASVDLLNATTVDVKISPNPTAGRRFTLTFDGSIPAASAKVEVLTLGGRRLYNRALSTADETKVIVRLPRPLPAGTYVVRVSGGAGPLTRLLVVSP